MSLIASPWVPVAASATAAILVPALLLWPSEDLPEPAPQATLTVVNTIEVPPLAAQIEAPVFSPARTAAQTPAAADPTVEQAPPAQPPLLVGTIAHRRGDGVALVRNAAGETVALSPGQEADGWLLEAIGEGRVTMAQLDRRETLVLDFSKARAAGDPPALAASGQ